MKHLRFNFYAAMALMILLSIACSLSAAPATVAPLTQSPVEPSTTATLIPVPTEAVVTPTLAAINLSGPPMEVGSLFPYVDGSILVAVPGGKFTMGHGGSDNPEHEVTLSDFWIYQAKVTNQQYALCVSAGKCKTPDQIDNVGYADVARANDPVTGVNWDQASSYCTFVHGALPTEAQWEKTARGPDGNIYPWGDHAPACDYLNFNNCVGKTTEVTKYPQGQSYYHALDTEGNAFEWVADWYSALYYKNSPLQDPLGPDTGQQRSIRSSGYKSSADETPASTRRFDLPISHRRDLGFRCVVVDPTYFAPLCQSIGTTSGGTSNCPKVGIGLTPNCQAGIVTVTFTDSLATDLNASVGGVDPPKCSVLQKTGDHDFPQIYNCSSDVTATIGSKCTISASGPVACAPHYNLNKSTGMCEWDKSGSIGNQCLPGLAFDSSRQCCSVPSDKNANYPICPTGQTLGYVPPGNPVCVPNGQIQAQPFHSEPVHVQDPATCTNHPGGGCTNPGQYSEPNSCQAAGCTWVKDNTRSGGSCH